MLLASLLTTWLLLISAWIGSVFWSLDWAWGSRSYWLRGGDLGVPPRLPRRREILEAPRRELLEAGMAEITLA